MGMETKQVVGWVILAIVIIAGSVWALERSKSSSPVSEVPRADQLVATATFTCDSEKTITAAFYAGTSTPPVVESGQPPVPTGSVALTLSDGRTMTLPQTLSADGGRYANADESIIFWNKGDTAFITEGGADTYTHCVTSSTAPSSTE